MQDNTKEKIELHHNGISCKWLGIILAVTAGLSVLLSLFEVGQMSVQSHTLYAEEQKRLECDMAIQQFMDGSDYLTNQVEQFVISGRREYMDSYWEEVNVTRSRDEAIEAILSSSLTEGERKAAEGGKSQSDSLIEGEKRAMRLMSESIGLTEAEMPPEIADTKLSQNDAALSRAEKKSAAIDFIFGQDYSLAKESIRSNVNSFRNATANRYSADSMAILEESERSTWVLSACAVLSCILFVAAAFSFLLLAVYPMVEYYRCFAKSAAGTFVQLDVYGVKEIRRFAKAFNAMSAQAEEKDALLERLGRIDYLTQVPNRAAITEYTSGLLSGWAAPLGLMIADIDNFKHFNDTYGHARGDVVLQKVANAICSVRPKNGGISGRLCGEEFIAVIKDADEETMKAAAEQMLDNVRNISGSDVGMPENKGFSVNVSIGGAIWRGDAAEDFISLLSKADKALYYSKRHGKDMFSFLDDIDGGETEEKI